MKKLIRSGFLCTTFVFILHIVTYCSCYLIHFGSSIISDSLGPLSKPIYIFDFLFNFQDLEMSLCRLVGGNVKEVKKPKCG